jgi:hypothetical protein
MKEAVRPGDPVVIHELRRLGPGPARTARVIATAAGGAPAGAALTQRRSSAEPPRPVRADRVGDRVGQREDVAAGEG